MLISIDTNVWIFGITNHDRLCNQIITNLAEFDVVLPNQIRAELHRNLTHQELHLFYRLMLGTNSRIDFEVVPLSLIADFEQKGLKKGDAEIGAFCEWRKISIFISDNRDFLKGLSTNHIFRVMSPAQFCTEMGLNP
jgi:predicted nucleic acid-binding protein